MVQEKNKNLKLGLFVIAGTILVVTALYVMGAKKNFFGSTFTLKAKFYNVNGLLSGNNVRYAGINIGTVGETEITNDTTVIVEMLIEKKMAGIIKKNSIASIGTDGLMGNKLVNISPLNGDAEFISEGDFLETKKPVETDEMMRTLDITNQNMRLISENLKNITDKIQNKNSLWKLLSDSLLADNIRSTMVNIKQAGNNTLMLTGNLKELTYKLKNGKGIGALITDTTFSARINQVIVKIQRVSDSAAIITGDISRIAKKIDKGNGTAAMLLNDTNFIHHLNVTVDSIKKTSTLLNEDLEGLKHSFLLRKYFKKKAGKGKNKK